MSATPEPDDDYPETEYSLVMPFVVCEDHGGPFKANAYTAAYEAAVVDRFLLGAKDLGTVTLGRYMRSDNVPQLDLIAMLHGFRLRTEPFYDENWTWCEFTNEPEESGD